MPKKPREMEKFSTYPACFIKEKNGYSVILPDLSCPDLRIVPFCHAPSKPNRQERFWVPLF